MAGKAIDKLYKFDENGNLVEVLVPTGIGFVGWYAGPEPPEGYLYCDGSAIGRETYSELYDAIGTLYGAGDGAETFNLPDARGVFFRGDGGENNAAMGVRQGDAIRNITGAVTFRTVQNATDLGDLIMAASGTFSVDVPIVSTSYTMQITETVRGAQKLNFQASRAGVPVANENRPINMALKPCIRYV